MKTKVPSLITILIFTLITTVSWIGFTVYRAIVAKPTPVVSKEVLEELNPDLNKDTINELKAKTP